MRHAVIIAGGAGTRLWPMSRPDAPKQLLPLVRGRSLLEAAWDRIGRFAPPERLWVCARESFRDAILRALSGFSPKRYLGEPEGRDTLNAIAFAAAVISREDAEATIGVFTADHLIEPEDRFIEIVKQGYNVAERAEPALVTFGIAPTRPATAYGYLHLGEPFSEESRIVTEFREKPDAPTAKLWVAEGPTRWLWNSGMLVFRAGLFLGCVERYEPAAHAAVSRIAEAWNDSRFPGTIAREYNGLRKVSVEHALMERASRDPAVKVVALPMALSWTDIGSWPALAGTCPQDRDGNALAAAKSLLVDSRDNLVASSDAGHLIALLGCDDLVVVHTATATLVCRRERAEDLKMIQSMAAERFGPDYA